MGRFMSPDPSDLYMADPSNPQTLNLYSYVGNNPLGYTDVSVWSGPFWCRYQSYVST
jgi:RHS repeat-associated protein